MYIYIHIGRQGAWPVTPEHDLEQKWRRAYAPPPRAHGASHTPPHRAGGAIPRPPPRKTSIKSTFPTKFGAALHPPLATFSTFSTFRHLGKLKTTQTPKFHLTAPHHPPISPNRKQRCKCSVFLLGGALGSFQGAVLWNQAFHVGYPIQDRNLRFLHRRCSKESHTLVRTCLCLRVPFLPNTGL